MIPAAAASPRPLWRRLLTAPAFWAVLSAAAALPWVLHERGMDLPPVIFSLLAGWLAGIGFVNWTFRTASPRLGVVLHAVVALACAALMITMVQAGTPGLRLLPDGLRAPAIMVQFALIPATGWMLLGLLGRITTLARRPAKNPRTAPEWDQDKTGSTVEFRAVRMPVVALVWWGMALFVLVSTGLAILLVTDSLPTWVSTSPMVFLALGALIALPPFLIFRGVCAARTIPVSARFTRGALRIRWAENDMTLPLNRISRLVWCPTGESARLEVSAPGIHLSLLVSVARPARGRLAQLPPLQRRTEAALAEAGLPRVIAPKSRAKKRPTQAFERVFEEVEVESTRE
ncbi:hypothetical protein [Mycetocola saprophilus]|uniref:hypothetical protein n=1 Tax=Mycetocola saprophilus TaxID=76636 RepID=UPI003BF14148